MSIDKDVPCYNCQKRDVGCHSSCEKYKYYVEKRHKKKRMAEAHWCKEKAFYSYCEDRTKRLNRLKGKY